MGLWHSIPEAGDWLGVMVRPVGTGRVKPKASDIVAGVDRLRCGCWYRCGCGLERGYGTNADVEVLEIIDVDAIIYVSRTSNVNVNICRWLVCECRCGCRCGCSVWV